MKKKNETKRNDDGRIKKKDEEGIFEWKGRVVKYAKDGFEKMFIKRREREKRDGTRERSVKDEGRSVADT